VRQARCRSLPASASVVGYQTPWKAVRIRLDACGNPASESNGVGLSRRLRRGHYSEDGAAEAYQALRDVVVEARDPRVAGTSAVVSGRGGALRPRLERTLRTVASGGDTGCGRVVSGELSERLARPIASDRPSSGNPFTGVMRCGSPQVGDLRPSVAFGSHDGGVNRSAGDSAGDVAHAVPRTTEPSRLSTGRSFGSWFDGSSSPAGALCRTAVFGPFDGEV
jgi:hypothetical protein